jgi:hypothetical protein
MEPAPVAAGAGGVPVALELHRDYLPARRKWFGQPPEIEVDGHQATVGRFRAGNRPLVRHPLMDLRTGAARAGPHT